MKLLIVGGGGREHALADKLRRDAPAARLFVAPGNPGIGQIATQVPLDSDDLAGLANFAETEAVDLTVVGPEAPLAAGIADLFAERDLPLFGPSRAAARLEASKAFAKRLMSESSVPTAEFEVFTDPEAARRYVESREPPLVVKASGLAAGKGAIVCESGAAALRAIDETLVDDRFGEAGREIVVEEFMEGVEISVFFLTDGEHAVGLVPSRDYKRIGEGDRGPNTGGMGAYAPAADPAARSQPTDALIDRIRQRIALPILNALAERGTPYRGFLYAGLMLTESGPRVVEFNCRLGDPETQAVLPLTESNLLEPMLAVGRGEALSGWRATTSPGAALVTVLASAGYPGRYEKGKRIRIPGGLAAEDRRIYHAGTAEVKGHLASAGGRVLGVTGIGPSLEAAAALSREGAERIEFEGKQWRRDIGWHERADL